jgi:hypothetical protein
VESQFAFTFREWRVIRRILGLRMRKHRTLLGDYSMHKDTYRTIEDTARKLYYSRVNPKVPKVPAATWRSLSLLLEKVAPEMHDRAEFESMRKTAEHYSRRGRGKPKNRPLIRTIVTLALHYLEATGKRPTCYWDADHETTYKGPFFELVVACCQRASDLKPKSLGAVVREILSVLGRNGVWGNKCL